MGSIGAHKASTSPKSKEELKEELKGLRADYVDFVKSHSDESGLMDADAVDEMLRMQDKMDAVEYELHSQLSPTVSEEKWNPNNVTALSYEDAQTVRKDMLKNRDMYLAIVKAQHGVGFIEGAETNDTPVDTLYKKNKDAIYKLFEPSRKMLQKKYGDTITLYRVPTSQTAKATVNMTSTRVNAEEYAKIYGRKVESVKVPVKDILAINVTRTGKYEEFIVLNRKGK